MLLRVRMGLGHWGLGLRFRLWTDLRRVAGGIEGGPRAWPGAPRWEFGLNSTHTNPGLSCPRPSCSLLLSYARRDSPTYDPYKR